MALHIFDFIINLLVVVLVELQMQYHQIMHKMVFYVYKDKSQGTSEQEHRWRGAGIVLEVRQVMGYFRVDDDRLYELFKQRGENNSTIFVEQYPVDEWHNKLGNGFYHGQNHT